MTSCKASSEPNDEHEAYMINLVYKHPSHSAYPAATFFKNCLYELRDHIEADTAPSRNNGHISPPQKRIKRGVVDDDENSDADSNSDNVPSHQLCYYAGSQALCIYDKYPKARYHALLVPASTSPLGQINSISDLIPEKHLTHVKQFHSLGKRLAAQMTLEIAKTDGGETGNAHIMLGYHAVPSINLLHLHILSSDLDSTSVKTKKHINSFISSFFVNPIALEESIVSRISRGEKARSATLQIRNDEAEKILKTHPLQCSRCHQSSKNVPDWKRHNVTCRVVRPTNGDVECNHLLALSPENDHHSKNHMEQWLSSKNKQVS